MPNILTYSVATSTASKVVAATIMTSTLTTITPFGV
jgi:hypothetical protein